MRFFRPYTKVCQNCMSSDNTKGMWFRYFWFWNNWDKRGTWSVYCKKDDKYRRWNKFKRCYHE